MNSFKSVTKGKWRFMKRRLKGIAATLALIISVTACASPFGGTYDSQDSYSETEGRYPVKWNLDKIYASEEEWQADYDKVMAMFDEYDKYRGKLDNAKTIREYFDYAYFTEMSETQQKLMMYASLGNSLDATDPVYKNLLAKLDAMTREETQKSAFVDDELYALSLEERKKIFSDPLFDGDEYWLRQYLDPDYEPLSEEETLLVSTMSMGMGYGEQVFDILNQVELPYPTIKMPNGKEEDLTDQLYVDIISDPKYSDKFKAEANQTYLTRYEDFANTFAALLEENCSQAYASALIDGFDTTMDEAFDDYDLDTKVFDMLIEAAHEGIPEYQRYLKLHAQGLGLEEQYPYNMGTSVSDFSIGKTDYDDAVDEVIEALGILGDDYIDHFTKIITSEQVDVYPTDNKATGAFENKISSEYYPWVLFNYGGYSDDISTIAHEMGHAVYDQYATENQRKAYNNPTIFTQEVASTTNELLYYDYKLKNAKDDEEKLFYLENAINMFAGTFFTQMMYSEFEDYMYKVVESGQSLDAEDLGDKWAELVEEYRGDAVTTFPASRYQWASIPHFYYVYYVYQYSADVAYAASIADRITSNEPGAVGEYISFLKLGGSEPPVELLSKAGVDPLSDATYDEALAYFKKLVDEYEVLVNEK